MTITPSLPPINWSSSSSSSSHIDYAVSVAVVAVVVVVVVVVILVMNICRAPLPEMSFTMAAHNDRY